MGNDFGTVGLNVLSPPFLNEWMVNSGDFDMTYVDDKVSEYRYNSIFGRNKSLCSSGWCSGL